jgi:hypothetical protein
MIRFRVKSKSEQVSLSRPSDVAGFTENVKLPVRGPRLARYVDVPAAYADAASERKDLVEVK